MIRINLLPREARRRRIGLKVPQAAIVALAVIILVGMWGYWRLVTGEVKRLRADIAATQSEIARNQQIVRLIEQYARDKKQLQDRIAVIQRLSVTQEIAVRLLDGISQALPDDVWLAGLSKVSGKLVVQGYASSHFAVANLMDALARIKPLIGGVELVFSERQVVENKPVERFEIVAALSE